MNVFRLDPVSSAPGVGCVFVGRGQPARPEPATLIPCLGLDPAPQAIARVRQVHSALCVVVRGGDGRVGEGIVGEGDAILTSSRGLALGVATADCVPLVAYDPGAGALGVIHAGWRGTLAGVLPAAVAAMEEQLGADRRRLLVAAGPAAGACCYRVGPEVVDAFASAHPDMVGRIVREGPAGTRSLDLVEANRLQASAAGVGDAHFRSAGMCTVCRPDLFHSYRRDGEAAGRMWLLAAMRPSGAPASRPSS